MAIWFSMFEVQYTYHWYNQQAEIASIVIQKRLSLYALTALCTLRRLFVQKESSNGNDTIQSSICQNHVKRHVNKPTTARRWFARLYHPTVELNYLEPKKLWCLL